MVVGLAWLVLIVYHFCYHCMFIVHLEFDYHLISVLIFPSSLSYFCICTPSRKSQQELCACCFSKSLPVNLLFNLGLCLLLVHSLVHFHTFYNCTQTTSYIATWFQTRIFLGYWLILKMDPNLSFEFFRAHTNPNWLGARVLLPFLLVPILTENLYFNPQPLHLFSYPDLKINFDCFVVYWCCHWCSVIWFCSLSSWLKRQETNERERRDWKWPRLLLL